MRFSSAVESFGAIAVAVALSLAPSAWADQEVVKVSKSDKLGSFLTDAKGATLYTFKKDTAGKSACAGDCATKWPAYYSEKVSISGNLKQDDFGTITRDDGKKQTTYKGMPLYYFSGDKAPGDTAGEGFLKLWTVAKP